MDVHQCRVVRGIAVALAFLWTGLSSFTYAQDEHQDSGLITKICFDRGSPLYGSILSQDSRTLLVRVADSDIDVTLEWEKIVSIVEVPRRQQFISTQISWNPTLFYYRALIDPVNIGVTAEYIWRSGWMDSVKAVEVGVELRVLPFGENLRGFYLATYLDYATLTVDRPDLTFSRWWSNGWLIGWQWFPLYNVAAGVCMGGETWYFPDSEKSYRELGYSGRLIGRIQIGYAW